MFFSIFTRHIVISIHEGKIYNHRAYTIIIIKVFFTEYENEHKEHKFCGQKIKKVILQK